MANSKPLNCPSCGGTATVEPHLIEAGCTVGNQAWTDWWTASVNCDSCAMQYVGGGDTEEEAVDDALRGWNRRAAVTDEQFAYAVHDGGLWGACAECDERRGYHMDAETIRGQQEHIEELKAEVGRLRAGQAEAHAKLAKATELMRDMAEFGAGDWRYTPLARTKHDDMLSWLGERLREFGIGGDE